jgi:hypothetical protein
MTFISTFKNLGKKIMGIEKFRLFLNFVPFMQYAGNIHGK